MADLNDIRQEIEFYERTYRSRSMESYKYGDLYDLFPSATGQSDACKLAWPHTWPNCHDAGIYALFDDEFNLIYVGKASFNSCIGARLSSYCAYHEDKSCRLKQKDNWTKSPRYAWSVAMPKDTPFEAPALEEYLIRKLQPPENNTGRLNSS